MTGAPVLVVERRGAIVRLTMNRPAAAHALDAALQAALVDALSAAQADAEVRAVVLRGQGERVFSAGADLKEYAGLPAAQARPLRRELLRRTLLAFVDFDKPMVACVNGQAVGAGCFLAQLADEVLAADTARFSLPEIRLGSPTPVGATIVAARCGRRVAFRLAQAGESIDAPLAVALGLADSAWPSERLEAACDARAQALAALAPEAFAQNKRWINERLRDEIVRALDVSARLQQAEAILQETARGPRDQR